MLLAIARVGSRSQLPRPLECLVGGRRPAGKMATAAPIRPSSNRQTSAAALAKASQLLATVSE